MLLKVGEPLGQPEGKNIVGTQKLNEKKAWLTGEEPVNISGIPDGASIRLVTTSERSSSKPPSARDASHARSGIPY